MTSDCFSTSTILSFEVEKQSLVLRYCRTLQLVMVGTRLTNSLQNRDTPSSKCIIEKLTNSTSLCNNVPIGIEGSNLNKMIEISEVDNNI